MLMCFRVNETTIKQNKNMFIINPGIYTRINTGRNCRGSLARAAARGARARARTPSISYGGGRFYYPPALHTGLAAAYMLFRAAGAHLNASASFVTAGRIRWTARRGDSISGFCVIKRVRVLISEYTFIYICCRACAYKIQIIRASIWRTRTIGATRFSGC